MEVIKKLRRENVRQGQRGVGRGQEGPKTQKVIFLATSASKKHWGGDPRVAMVGSNVLG